MRMLIVDDSMYQRQVLRSHLSKYGDCDEARDGAQAVELFRQALEEGRPYGLVVMDILMPVMDGHEALRRIIALRDRAGAPEEGRARTIMLSTLSDPETMLAAQFESGADMYLTKPVEGATLVEAVENLCLNQEDPDDEPPQGLCPAPGGGAGPA